MPPTSSARREIPGPYPPQEIRRFLDTFFYAPEAVLIDEITRLDSVRRVVEGRLDTTRPLPVGALQRGDPERHPPHVSGPDMILITAMLGSIHAWFFHHCRWDEGWAGFGNRIHRADFRSLARVGPPLLLRSTETRTRVGARRVVLRLEFEFSQEERQVYFGDQSAIFVKDKRLTREERRAST